MKQLVLMMAGLAATAVCACSAHSQDPPRDDSDKYIVKDGWRVRGYAGSVCTADWWYDNPKEADEAKTAMEGYTETNGKVYNRVTKDPEPRRFYVGRPSGYDPRPKDTETSRSQSGSAGGVPNGVIPAPGAKKPGASGETIFDKIKPPLKNWYQNRGKGGTLPEPVEPQRLELIERFKGFDGPAAPPPPPIEFPPGFVPKQVNPLKMNAPAPMPAPAVLPPSKGTPYNSPPISRSRGYGYDESAVKELAPKGVTMRVGINGGTLQRAEAPPALLDAIRGVK